MWPPLPSLRLDSWTRVGGAPPAPGSSPVSPSLWLGLPGADRGGADCCLTDPVLPMDNEELLLRGGRQQKLVPAASVFTGAEPSPAVCLCLPCRREES